MQNIFSKQIVLSSGLNMTINLGFLGFWKFLFQRIQNKNNVTFKFLTNNVISGNKHHYSSRWIWRHCSRWTGWGSGGSPAYQCSEIRATHVCGRRNSWRDTASKQCTRNLLQKISGTLSSGKVGRDNIVHFIYLFVAYDKEIS